MSPTRTNLIATAVLVLFVIAATETSAEPFETIVNNGSPQNRVDIAILGDGYTAAESQKYQNDVQAIIQAIFAQEPFKEYQRYFNVHRISVISNQSGADHPERTPPVFVDTVLDSTYNCSGIQRLICLNTSRVNTIVANTLSPSQRDLILVIVNDPEYGGSGGSVVVSSTNVSVIELVLHEAGHSFGLLGDEYGGPPPPACNNTIEPPYPNVTRATQRPSIKWIDWIDSNTPIPTTSTTPGVPGLYEAASYCDLGLYRPTYRSKMRVLGFPFEQINSEQLIKRIYNLVSPLDSSFPVAGILTLTQGQTQQFSVLTTVPLSHSLTLNWSVDGQHRASGSSFALDSNDLSSGAHNVEVTVTDPTEAVRSDPNRLLSARRSWSVTTPTPTATTIQFASAVASVAENGGSATVTVSRSGNNGVSTVDYATVDSAGLANCNVLNSGYASSRCDYAAKIGRLRFEAGQSSKTISILIVDDGYGEGNEQFSITLSNAVGASLGAISTATVIIIDNQTENGGNPINQAGFFAREHYLDFFSRESDASGLAFWTNQITSCGADTACLELRRINVSAAFFLSIEFQQTGYLVYRMYKAAYGNVPDTPVPVRFHEFLPDTQQIGLGVVVGETGWEQVLENNKNLFAADFVARMRFDGAHATTLSPAQFVDALFVNAGVIPTPTERMTAIGEFGGAVNTVDTAARGRVLRLVAEHPTLAQQEFNKAFVLMQYLGYLRRNPNDAPDGNFDGYNFWLGKLNQFNGNFVNAEMVKAFILAGEYQQRFGP